MLNSILLLLSILITFTCVQCLNDPGRFTWTRYALNSLKSHKQAQSRIVGGTLADAEQGPFIVQIATMITGKHVCGGSLISSRTVLTAGHCRTPEGTNGEPIHVRFDGLSRFNLKQYRGLIKIIRHPEFTYNTDGKPDDFDYCLPHLDEEVIPSDTVKFIRIADEMPAPGEKVLALGWGRTEYSSKSAVTLKQANFTIIDRTNCKLEFETPFTDRYICVSEPGNSICYGDSGGPLIFNKKLLGVSSFGNFHRCVPGLLDVYANAIVVKKWIEKNKI